ncbi:hypothetical protein QU38_02135, partial [Staphylococcus aureus]
APALPEDRRERTDRGGHDQDPRRAAHRVRRASPRQVHPRRDQVGSGAERALHQRPQAARQGDRRDRRSRRDADAGAAVQAQEAEPAKGNRGRDRHHGAHPAKGRVDRRRQGAGEPGDRPEAGRVRPGQGDRGAVVRDQAEPRGPARSGQADRQLSLLGP